MWSNFEYANFTNGDLKGTKFNYSVFRHATFRKTSMENADLSWCVLFDTDRGEVDLKNALTSTAAWQESDLTAEGMALAAENVEKLKNILPYDLWLILKYITENNLKKLEKAKENLETSLESLRKLKHYSSEEKKLIEEVGLGAYAKIGIKGYVTETKYKTKNAYQR